MTPGPAGLHLPLRALFARHEFLRYVLVGMLNTGFSYGLYALLMWLGLEYRLASLLALMTGILWSYGTQGFIVFRQVSRLTLLKFVLAWGLLYGLNIGIIALLGRVGFNAYQGGAIAIIPVTLMSYGVLKFAVFTDAQSPRST